MTSGYSSAVEQALALSRAPALLSAIRTRPLPADLPVLFRLAAGDAEVQAQLAGSTGESERALFDAAVFYLQQVLFAPGSDNYRVLGVEASAPDEQIKEHYRLLVRWLHPDRNIDEWDAIYADRVNRAWQALRTPDKRREYDEQRKPSGRAETSSGVLSDARLASSTLAERRPGDFRGHAVLMDQRAVLSSRAVRNLPLLVLGGLGSLAAVALGAVWYLDQAESAYAGQTTRPQAALITPSEATPRSAEVASEVPAGVEAPVEETQVLTAAPIEQIRSAESMAVSSTPAATDRPSPVLATTVLSAGPSPTRLPAADPEPEPVPVAAAPVTAIAPAAPPPPDSSGHSQGLVGSNDQVEAAPVAAVELPVRVADSTPSPAQTAPIERVSGTPARDASAELQASAQALLAKFQKAYSEGDIDTFMTLFTRDARQNRGGRDAIAKDYGRLFDSSDSRSIELQKPLWLPDGDRGSMTAHYQVVLLSRGTVRPRTVTGDIRFDLKLEDGSLRIAQLLHE